MMQTNGKIKFAVCGVVGFFDNPNDLVKATQLTKEAQFPLFDAFTPFPVHGLDTAQGLKRSPIPFVTFLFGITGTVLAFLYQYWTSAIDWPLNVGGKPFNSWPAFVPVMFEVTVLLGGLSTFAAMLFFCRLPNRNKPLLDPSITKDKFALFIEAPIIEDEEESNGVPIKKFNEDEAREFLIRIGAQNVRALYGE